jgi:hypothetical protein
MVPKEIGGNKQRIGLALLVYHGIDHDLVHPDPLKRSQLCAQISKLPGLGSPGFTPGGTGHIHDQAGKDLLAFTARESGCPS